MSIINLLKGKENFKGQNCRWVIDRYFKKGKKNYNFYAVYAALLLFFVIQTSKSSLHYKNYNLMSVTYKQNIVKSLF